MQKISVTVHPGCQRGKTERSLKLRVLWGMKCGGVSWPPGQGHTEPAGWSSCPGPPAPPPSCLGVSGLPTGETHILTVKGHIPHPIAALCQHKWKNMYSLQTWGLQNPKWGFSSYKTSNSSDSMLISLSLPPSFNRWISSCHKSRGGPPTRLLFWMIIWLFHSKML